MGTWGGSRDRQIQHVVEKEVCLHAIPLALISEHLLHSVISSVLTHVVLAWLPFPKCNRQEGGSLSFLLLLSRCGNGDRQSL